MKDRGVEKERERKERERARTRAQSVVCIGVGLPSWMSSSVMQPLHQSREREVRGCAVPHPLLSIC